MTIDFLVQSTKKRVYYLEQYYVYLQLCTMTLIHKCLKTRKRVCNYPRIIVLLTLFVWIYIFKTSKLVLKPCNIERLDPWDLSLTQYFSRLSPVVCSHRQQLIYVDKLGFLRFNDSLVKEYRIDTAVLQCSYYSLKRGLADTNNVTFDAKIKITLPVFVKCHMFRIQCVNPSNIIIYDFLHFNAAWSENAKKEDDIEDESEDRPSVIVFGIDSVSRSHAVRALPKSYEFLLSEFQAYDFLGHNRVGENTWRNFIPLLAGKSHRKYLDFLHMIFHVDSLPFIWYEKEMARIATFYAEDRPELSAFTVFGQLGFKRPPTDYYFRPFTQGVHTFVPKIVDHVTKSHDCYGPKTMFDIQVDYLKGFLQRYENKRKFAMSWSTQISHSSYSLLSRADEPFLKFLKWLKVSNQTKNAVFIVMSDHGPRLGGAALTHVGRAENNKPWMMLHIPNSLKAKHKWIDEVISQNSKQLTSHYDTYETILNIFQNKAFTGRRTIPGHNSLLRRNLFNPIPRDRTCADAGIEEQFCTCDEKIQISPSVERVQSIAKFLVEKINKLLSGFSHLCHTYTLHNVSEVLVSYSKPEEGLGIYEQFVKHFYSDNSGRYKVVFYTAPGYAFFEGTVDFVDKSASKKQNSMTLIGEPIRLDRYDSKSKCIQNKISRPYCVCKI
ncbi:uncharacterized protein LOC123550214 [Mercenaria mercenaria]|uniref:uncharacterized protein LOC123550214 n=1 Tax=Mercenaria mercenaria TaxID=6596 RepID=UPI001E1D91D6|nr:uncharacterized protein LOC123550214 [Mercenaria mercenaria]